MSRRQVSGSELHQLRQSGRLDVDASHVALCHVYELIDGRVLLVYSDRLAFVDDSYQELARWLAANKHRSGQVVDEFRDLFPQGKNFVDCVDALIADLPSLLQLSVQRIDFSDDELAAVDRRLRKLPKAEFEGPKLFAALVAYVGECIRRSVDGKWEMVAGSDGTSVPQVVDSRGTVYLPTRIYKDFIDSGHIPSIARFIAGTLGRR